MYLENCTQNAQQEHFITEEMASIMFDFTLCLRADSGPSSYKRIMYYILRKVQCVAHKSNTVTLPIMKNITIVRKL